MNEQLTLTLMGRLNKVYKHIDSSVNAEYLGIHGDLAEINEVINAMEVSLPNNSTHKLLRDFHIRESRAGSIDTESDKDAFDGEGG